MKWPIVSHKSTATWDALGRMASWTEAGTALAGTSAALNPAATRWAGRPRSSMRRSMSGWRTAPLRSRPRPTIIILQRADPKADKFEVRDLVFDIDGIRYVRPAPVMGGPSDFFVRGRMRANSSGIETFPPMALIVPELTEASYAAIAQAIGEPGGALGDWPAWQKHLAGAREAATITTPLLTMPVDAQVFLDGCAATGSRPRSRGSIESRIRHSTTKSGRSSPRHASERRAVLCPAPMSSRLPRRSDRIRPNDVSDIALVREHPNGEPSVRSLAENLRIFHEHAVALAAAYAVREGVNVVQWNRNRRHGWY